MKLHYHNDIDPQWAWAEYKPTSQTPWTMKQVAHLYRRAGWGANWTELQTALKNGPTQTIDLLMTGKPGLEAFQTRVAKLAAPLEETADEHRLRAWWLYVMMNSPHPLLERMTLFWHNHFATSNAKVQHVGRMYRQNQLIRTHALKRFGPMLHAISEDPAMMVWLDTVSNRKKTPNENYARELMELFSLGIDQYTEQDIREAARAFAGWGIKNDAFHVYQEDIDSDSKKVFGKAGSFDGHHIVDMCLDKKACASFLSRKLFKHFMSDTLVPDDALIQPLAERFYKSQYDIADLVGVMLSSNLFFSPDCYRAKIKSPVEFGLGVIHLLEGRVDTIQFAEMLDPLGQRLFAPPSVKGWDGGAQWLNSSTLLQRHNLCLALSSTEDQRILNRCDPSRVVKKHKTGAQSELAPVVTMLSELLLQDDLPATTRERLQLRMKQLREQKYARYWNAELIMEYQIRSMCHLIMTLPEFQLL